VTHCPSQRQPSARDAIDGAPRRGERGMVLVMVVLMIGVLTLLGSAAALRTAMDMREGGAERLARASYRVAEAGTLGVVSLASQMQGGFSDYLSGKNEPKLGMQDVGSATLGLSDADHSFGRELKAVGTVDFETTVADSDSASAAGYDVGRYCFRTYRMVTTSRLGHSQPANLQQAMVSGQSRLQTSMTVGPIPCGP
jgi:hypothetical protein